MKSLLGRQGHRVPEGDMAAEGMYPLWGGTNEVHAAKKHCTLYDCWHSPSVENKSLFSTLSAGVQWWGQGGEVTRLR